MVNVSRIWLSFFALSLVLCLSVGCNGEKATLTGKVSFRGTPIAKGQVVFESGKNTFVGMIEDGQYTARTKGSTSLPLGTYKATVWPPIPERKINPKTAEYEAVSPVDVSMYPKKYQDELTSGLSVILEPGAQVYDIDMR